MKKYFYKTFLSFGNLLIIFFLKYFLIKITQKSSGVCGLRGPQVRVKRSLLDSVTLVTRYTMLALYSDAGRLIATSKIARNIMHLRINDSSLDELRKKGHDFGCRYWHIIQYLISKKKSSIAFIFQNGQDNSVDSHHCKIPGC